MSIDEHKARYRCETFWSRPAQHVSGPAEDQLTLESTGSMMHRIEEQRLSIFASFKAAFTRPLGRVTYFLTAPLDGHFLGGS